MNTRVLQAALLLAATLVVESPRPAFASPDPQVASQSASVATPFTLEEPKGCTKTATAYQFAARNVGQNDTVPPPQLCTIDLKPTSEGNAGVVRVRIRTENARGLLTARLSGAASRGWSSSVHVPLPVEKPANPTAAAPGTPIEIGSDTAATEVDLLVPTQFKGTLTIGRVDFGGALDFSILFSAEALQSPAMRRRSDLGQSHRVSLPVTTYRALIDLADSTAAREPVSTAASASTTDRDTAFVTAKENAYHVLSAIIGHDDDEKASKTTSEPLVVFVGLGGRNKIVLSDLVAWPMVVRAVSGQGRLAEPWQTSLERAEYVWAVYVEEEAAPFFTSVDADFLRSPRSDEHDDFDPQGIERADGAALQQNVPVRLGFKRFRIPDTFDVTRITFSRQSTSYGLRQWSKTFTRHGRYPIRVTGAVVVPAPMIERRDYVLTPVYVDDNLTPGAYSIEEVETIQPIFAAAAIRYPQLRASADQAPLGWARLWRSILPEPILGIGVPFVKNSGFGGQSLLFGGSWPIVGDRVHVVLGRVKVREPYAEPGVSVPSRVPANSPPVEELRSMRTAWKTVAAISVDLARTW